MLREPHAVQIANLPLSKVANSSLARRAKSPFAPLAQANKNTRDSANFSQPLWLGDSSVAKKTILLHAEQGLGDTLMACRYVPMVAALGASVILEVQPPLASLLKCLEGVTKLVARGDEISDFDIHCPLMSLPLAFKIRLDRIPAKVPYLTVPKEKIAQWRSRLGESGFKIGVAWAGSPGFVDE